jgi:hypothetical protein
MVILRGQFMVLSEFQSAHELHADFDDSLLDGREAEHMGRVRYCHFVDGVDCVIDIFVVYFLPRSLLLSVDVNAIVMFVMRHCSQEIAFSGF